MNRSAAHRISLLLAAANFALLAQGAIGVSLGRIPSLHAGLGWAIGALAVTWFFLLRRVEPGMTVLGAGVLLAVAGSAWTGLWTTPAAKISHATLSHMAFALSVAGCAVTSKSWEARLAVADGGWPTLRSLAWLTPSVVLLQVMLGAAYRHKVTGLIPHVSWAFVAAMFVMMAGAFTLSQCGGHKALRRWSVALMTVTGVQFVLGVIALVGRLSSEGTAPGAGMVVSTVLHLLVGAVVLALSLGLSAQTLRHVEVVRGSAAVREGELA